jgi:hypothetical protein
MVQAKAIKGEDKLTDESVPQSFLRACQEAAQETSSVFWPNCIAGATAENGTILIEVRAYEGTCVGADLSASGSFTTGNELQDVRNYFSQAVPQTTNSFFGNVRVDTAAPQTPPASHVEPAPENAAGA